MIEALFTAWSWIQWGLTWLGWFGIGLVPFAAAAAVIWFVPPLRKWAILAAIGWGLAFGGYTYGDINGAARITRDWKAAEQRAIEKGADAREQAEREVGEEDRAAPPAAPVCDSSPRASRVPNDRYDRDNP